MSIRSRRIPARPDCIQLLIVAREPSCRSPTRWDSPSSVARLRSQTGHAESIPKRMLWSRSSAPTPDDSHSGHQMLRSRRTSALRSDEVQVPKLPSNSAALRSLPDQMSSHPVRSELVNSTMQCLGSVRHAPQITFVGRISDNPWIGSFGDRVDELIVSQTGRLRSGFIEIEKTCPFRFPTQQDFLRCQLVNTRDLRGAPRSGRRETAIVRNT